ncbi:YdgH/BhsA/McbA-like domain containing protein [Acerihabitans sp. TG2]|uniref:YdgH/BhsA/McbA-like domain containing protein n=1 Tax=Acerihabitans sp. TG2 TaxID=3096008 RepID=UPI002B236F61|nr:YdgH/BhsA/McbA-like domain containing protein [Acerihabitans sp. TG2]MEA9389261.1 YdgH/BhsA/McbA-like domain containing protein [Acerihabitans sp. TG2]
MKFIKSLSVAAVAALSLMSFNTFADQSVSVTSSTLDGAEAKIAAQAQQQGAQYKIVEANTNNRVHMTAELYK